MKYKMQNTRRKVQEIFMREKSFTLVEVLVVVGILAIISTAGFVELSLFKSRHSFDLDFEAITEAIQTAQGKALQQEGGTAWGIRFNNSTTTAGTYQIFQGSSYSTSSVVDSEPLSSATVYVNPPSGFYIDVVFSARTGIPTSGTATTIVIQRNGGSDIYTITISASGRISKNLETGLIGYWPMDEGSGGTIYDASGYGHNGTISIGASGTQTTVAQAWANGASGRVDGSLNFDGTDDTVPLSNIPVNTAANATTTVSFWMYWNGGNQQMPFAFNGYNLLLYSSYFGFNAGHGDLYGVSSSGLSGKWIFVTALFINAYAPQLYINGVQQSLSQVLGPNYPMTVSSVAQIANQTGGTGYYFANKIDDLRIYNRGLSATEIQNLYNSY